MFEPILHGVKPTNLFNELIAREPGLSNEELASRFVDYFENVDGLARQVIWYWQRPGGKTQGMNDENLNAFLLKLLREAGYTIEKSQNS